MVRLLQIKDHRRAYAWRGGVQQAMCGSENYLWNQIAWVQMQSAPGGFFFWTRFENLVAKRRKINDRVVPILVAIRNWNDVIGCQDPRKSLSLP